MVLIFFERKLDGGQFDGPECGENARFGVILDAEDFNDKVFVFVLEDFTSYFKGWGEETVGGSPFLADETEFFDLLVRCELLVVEVYNFLHFLVDFRDGDELVVVAVVEMVLESPVVESVEVGRDNCSGNFLVFSYDHYLVYIF